MSTAIQYQGRQARRLGSEQRRRAILEAALQIIVSEGIRNVRHRAVAREADVPLSATTYYFKDITDLICDAFTLFAENAMDEVIEPFREQTFMVLDRVRPEELADPLQRDQLLDLLADMTTAFVLEQLNSHRAHLVAEQAFLYEAVLDSRLRDLAMSYRHSQLQVLEDACKLLGSSWPAVDAELMLTTLQAIEYQLLVQDKPVDANAVTSRLRFVLEKIAGRGEV